MPSRFNWPAIDPTQNSAYLYYLEQILICSNMKKLSSLCKTETIPFPDKITRVPSLRWTFQPYHRRLTCVVSNEISSCRSSIEGMSLRHFRWVLNENLSYGMNLRSLAINASLVADERPLTLATRKISHINIYILYMGMVRFVSSQFPLCDSILNSYLYYTYLMHFLMVNISEG